MTNHEAQLIAQTTMEQFRQAAARQTTFDRVKEARDAISEHSRWMKQQGIRITPIRAREEDKPC